MVSVMVSVTDTITATKSYSGPRDSSSGPSTVYTYIPVSDAQ